MQSTTIAVDTAKLIFELVVSDGRRVVENHRLNRSEFQAFIVRRPRSRFVMEACAGAHHQHPAHVASPQPAQAHQAAHRGDPSHRPGAGQSHGESP